MTTGLNIFKLKSFLFVVNITSVRNPVLKQSSSFFPLSFHNMVHGRSANESSERLLAGKRTYEPGLCGASAELCGSLIYRQRPLPRLTPLVTYQALSVLWVCAGAQCHWQLTLCLFYLFKMSLPHIVAPSFQAQVPDSPSHISVSPCGVVSFILCISYGEAAILFHLMYLTNLFLPIMLYSLAPF